MTRFGLMIERALIWEPTNRYCWMLWADWFLVQGHREACESTLREMLRLFPSDVHARVELARTLIARRKDYRDEAEHLLRQAMARDPDGGHARVVMARLLVSRHRPSDAEALLAEFLERHPDNLDVQRSLGRLRAGMYVFDDGRDEIRGAIGCDGPPKPLSGPLHELFRRGLPRRRIQPRSDRQGTGQRRTNGSDQAGNPQRRPVGRFLFAVADAGRDAGVSSPCLGVERVSALARVGERRSLATSGDAVPRGHPGDGVPSRSCHNGRRQSSPCNSLARSLWLPRWYGTPCRGCLYARGAGTTRFSGPARTRRARRSGDGLRLGGRSRIPAGTRCLKAWTGLLAFCCASKIAVGK